jgi:hypothetical protein
MRDDRADTGVKILREDDIRVPDDRLHTWGISDGQLHIRSPEARIIIPSAP